MPRQLRIRAKRKNAVRISRHGHVARDLYVRELDAQRLSTLLAAVCH